MPMPSDYARLATAIRFLEQLLPRQPRLVELAAAIHPSPFHLQRLFQRCFLQWLTV